MIDVIDDARVYRILMTSKDLTKLWIATRNEVLAAVLESALYGLETSQSVRVVMEVSNG